MPKNKWKCVATLFLDHDLCNPLVLPLWTETQTLHLSQQHVCTTPSYPAEGFSSNSDLFICCFSSAAAGCTASDWLLSVRSLVCHARKCSLDVLRKKSVQRHLSGNVGAWNKNIWTKMEGLGFFMSMNSMGCHIREVKLSCPKSVAAFSVPGPGASTHLFPLISRNCLRNLAFISIPASGDRIVYYRSPIDCKIVIPIHQMRSCKLRYLWCQTACFHSCCMHEFSRFTHFAYQTSNSLPSKTCRDHKQLQSSQWNY